MSRKITRGVDGDRVRPTVRLGAELEKSLAAYTMAAMAAGVGMLAVGSAEAKIVYTPANVPIPVNGGPVVIDLNHDGRTDFVVSNFFSPGTEGGVASSARVLVSASGKMQNQVWGRAMAAGDMLRRYSGVCRSDLISCSCTEVRPRVWRGCTCNLEQRWRVSLEELRFPRPARLPPSGAPVTHQGSGCIGEIDILDCNSRSMVRCTTVGRDSRWGELTGSGLTTRSMRH
jgi:hypothetical protein